MEESLSMILVQRIAIIAVLAYVFSHTKIFRFMFKERKTIQDDALLIGFFFCRVNRRDLFWASG